MSKYEEFVPVHSYHRFESLLAYMNDYITHLALVIGELKVVVEGIVGTESREDRLPPRCFNERCEVEYMMGVCRQNMDDIMRVNHLLKGFQQYTRSKPPKGEEYLATPKTQGHPVKSASSFGARVVSAQ